MQSYVTQNVFFLMLFSHLSRYLGLNNFLKLINNSTSLNNGDINHDGIWIPNLNWH